MTTASAQTVGRRAALALTVVLIASLLIWLRTETGQSPALDLAPTTRSSQAEAQELESTSQPAAGAQRSVAAATPVAPTSDPLAPAPEAAPAAAVTVLARCVDGKGSPLEHVTLTATDLVKPLSAESGSDGRVRLEIPWPMDLSRGNPSWVMTTATRPGWTRLASPKRLHGPGTVDLGDLQFFPGGTLSGRVVDSAGAPIAKAYVWVVGASLPGSAKQEEQRRVQAKPFPYIGSNALHTPTDERGHYRIEGVPAREVSVVAQTSGMSAAYTRPLVIVAGVEAQADDLVLLPVEDKNLIRGIVLSQGQPVTDAEILVFENRGARNVNPQARAWTNGVTGRFQVPVLSRTPFTLVASSREQPGFLAVLHDITAGMTGVELVFPEPRHLHILATGPQGEAIENPVAWMYDEESRTSLPFSNVPHPDGGIQLPVPAKPFSLSLQAKGYRPQRLGPWEPESAPKSLKVAMQRATLLTGRVLFQGAPVAGALVHVHEPHKEERPIAFGGKLQTHWSSHYGRPTSTQSDADGSFELAVLGSGMRLLHAEAKGYAAAELGPIDVVEDRSMHDLVLVLSRGGRLDGRVRMPRGEPSVGTVVAASRGDGHVTSTLVDEEGRFQFNDLCPGAWQVARVDGKQIDRLQQQYTRTLDRTQRERVVTVQLAEGETAELELDLSHLVRCTLSGLLQAYAGSSGVWSVHLSRGQTYARTVADQNGSYTLSLVAEGPADFHAGRPEPQGGRTTLSRMVQLQAGSNSLDATWPTGALRLTDLPPAAPRHTDNEQLGFALVNRDAGGMLWTRTFDHDHGSWNCASLPSGDIELRRRQDPRYSDPVSWPLLASFPVGIGESTRYAAPENK